MTDKESMEGSKQYLIFSDEQLDLIYEYQSKITVEFTEEEKNFKFIKAVGPFTPSKDTDFKL